MKKGIESTYEKLRAAVTDHYGNKVYQEKILEYITQIETNSKAIREQFEAQAADVDKLTKEYDALFIRLNALENADASHCIHFGTGYLYYRIGQESAITVTELMDAIKNAAMIVPLPRVINAINGTTK